MWIVRLALRRPYTFVVMAILILAMGAISIYRTPTDIFPNINIHQRHLELQRPYSEGHG
jgi:multidrug efflux pump subunit AcrB